MPYREFFWTDRAIQKVEDNDLTTDDVEFAVLHATSEETSKSTGKTAYRGKTPDGRTIFVVYDEIDATQISVVTAFKVGK